VGALAGRPAWVPGIKYAPGGPQVELHARVCLCRSAYSEGISRYRATSSRLHRSYAAEFLDFLRKCGFFVIYAFPFPAPALHYHPLTPARSPCIPPSTRLSGSRARPAPRRAAARAGGARPARSTRHSGLRFGSRLYLGYSMLLCVVPEPHSEDHMCMLLQCRQHVQAVFNRSCNPIFTRSLREAARARTCARRTRRRRAGEPASNPQVHEAPPHPPSGVSTSRIQTSHAAAMLRRCRRDLGPMPAWIARPPEPRLAPRRLYARP
jgi:hypothetical protein